MPTRSRSHELESLSRAAFAGLVVERGWVFRDAAGSDDYGIDGEVEIFDSGNPTGLISKVQLEASDADPRRGAFRDISLDHFEYWGSLDLPVLLVYFMAKDQQFYCKWVHRYDFGKPVHEQKSTHRVRSGVEDHLQHRLASLSRELADMRSTTSGVPPRPLPLRVHIEPTQMQEDFARFLRERFRRLDLRRYVKLLDDADDELAFVATATTRGFKMTLPAASMGSLTVHAEDFDYSARQEWDSITADIVAGLGYLASRLGAMSDALALLRVSFAASQLRSHAVAAEQAAFVFVREFDLELAVEAILSTYHAPVPLGSGLEVLHDALQEMRSDLRRSDLRRLTASARQRIRAEARRGDYLQAFRVALLTSELHAGADSKSQDLDEVLRLLHAVAPEVNRTDFDPADGVVRVMFGPDA